MLRISVIEQSEKSIRLALDGSLTERWVEELRRMSENALADAETVELDLKNLRFVDQDGFTLLRELAGRNVKQINSSAFIRQQL